MGRRALVRLIYAHITRRLTIADDCVLVGVDFGVTGNFEGDTPGAGSSKCTIKSTY